MHEAVDGLGNRMLGLASSYLYAVLTGRVLLVVWPPEPGGVHAPLSDLFEDPGFAWSDDGMVITAALYRGYAALAERDAWDYDPDLGCRDLRQDSLPVVWMRSNQYYAPLLLHNPHWAAWLAQTGLSRAFFAHVVHRLFRPRAHLRARVDAWFAEHGIEPATAVAVHLRAFFPNQLLGLTPLFVRGAGIAASVLPPRPTATPTSSNGNATAASFVIASDWSDAAHAVAAALPAGRAHQISARSVSRQTRADAEAAVVELFILGRCARVVGTAGSTFGMVAQGLALGQQPQQAASTAAWGITVTSHDVVVRPQADPCYMFLPAAIPSPCAGVQLTSQLGRCEACCHVPLP